MELVVNFASESDKRELFRVLKTRKPRAYRITIAEERANRTSPQNRYYWGVVLATIAEHTGFSSDELHEYLKYKFNATLRYFPQTGEEVRVSGSTTELDTKAFGDYLNAIIDWALNDLDVYIPMPEATIIRAA